jgi:hypothetical protein
LIVVVASSPCFIHISTISGLRVGELTCLIY